MLTPSSNVFNLVRDQELGKQVSLEKFKDYKTNDNIKNNVCNVTFFKGHSQRIILLDVWDRLAATISEDNTVKLWNLETKKCQWTAKIDDGLDWKGMIKIVEGRLIFSGNYQSSNECKAAIQILNLGNGKQEALIDQLNLFDDKVCVIGQRIFGFLQSGEIYEWDTAGHLIEIIQSEVLDLISSTCLSSDRFLVEAANNTLIIHDIQNNTHKHVALAPSNNVNQKIHLYIEDCRLICGFENYEKMSIPDCCIVDLEMGVVLHQYHLSEHYDAESENIVCNMILKGEWAYLGYSTGKIIAINLTDHTSSVLDHNQKKIPVSHLAIDRQVLISNSNEMKFWNFKSRALILRKKALHDPYLSQVKVASGKVFLTAGMHFAEIDFLSPPKDRK